MVHDNKTWCKFSRYITRNWIWKLLTLRRIKFFHTARILEWITIKIQDRISDNNCFKLLLKYVCFIKERRGTCSLLTLSEIIYKILYQEMKLTCYLPLIQTTANHYKHNKITFHGIQREISRKRGKHIKSSDFISTIFPTPPSHAIRNRPEPLET